MANLIDTERRELAQRLGEALAANPGAYDAPDRIAATAALMAGDYRQALSYLGSLPIAAPGMAVDHRVLSWWDLAFALACKLEDAALAGVCVLCGHHGAVDKRSHGPHPSGLPVTASPLWMCSDGAACAERVRARCPALVDPADTTEPTT